MREWWSWSEINISDGAEITMKLSSALQANRWQTEPLVEREIDPDGSLLSSSNTEIALEQ